jgi:hypothetical protein
VVLVKEKIVKAVCKGAAVDFDQPLDGTLGIVLTVGSDSKHYCTTFGGSTIKNQATLTKRKSATATCLHVRRRATEARAPRQHPSAAATAAPSRRRAAPPRVSRAQGCISGSARRPLSLPAVTPDSVQPVIFDVDCCVRRHAAARPLERCRHRRQNLSCTQAGCFFGAPLPIPNTINTATSTCVVNTYERDARGELECSNGRQSRLDLPLVSEHLPHGRPAATTMQRRLQSGWPLHSPPS